MRKTPQILLFVICLALSSFGQGDQNGTSTVSRIMDVGGNHSQVMRHLNHLVNRIGPRLTSSSNCTKACEWAVEQFKGFGIENARMEQWGTFPLGFDRGLMTGKMITPEETALEFTTPCWTRGTNGRARGRAVHAPESMEELNAMKDELAGAWVISGAMNRRRRFRGLIDPEMEKAYVECGVHGVVFRASNDLVITFGNSGQKVDDLPQLPQVILHRGQWQTIDEALKADKASVVLEFDIENTIHEGPIPLYNVIADIPGTEFPDEYVIIGGHIDSWDGATGSTDNGTGCATTLEAARLLMATGAKPKRTIRFMLWSGEEQGLLGSRAWIEQHPEELPKISGVFVHDGGTNYVSGVSSTPAMMSDFENIFAPIMSLDGEMSFKIREVSALPQGIGSDHDSFLRVGVPGFFWGQKGRAVYRRTHHTQHDTYDAAIPEYQKHTSVVVAVGALGVANLDHKLSREGITRPRVGLNFDREMIVTQVVQGSLADKAGIKKGDKILQIGETDIASRREFRRALQRGTGAKKIRVSRDGNDVEITVEWPSQGRGGRRGRSDG